MRINVKLLLISEILLLITVLALVIPVWTAMRRQVVVDMQNELKAIASTAALEVSGERTKKAAVTKALREFIARREQKRILELFGSLDWDPDYDYKAERSRQ